MNNMFNKNIDVEYYIYLYICVWSYLLFINFFCFNFISFICILFYDILISKNIKMNLKIFFLKVIRNFYYIFVV